MVTKRTKRRIVAVLAVPLVLVFLTGAKGCSPQDQGSAKPTAKATPFAQPAGPAAPVPEHGNGRDPNDDDFYNAAKPPKGMPENSVTYEVRAMLYNNHLEPIGGVSTAFIDATPADPNVVGGVEGRSPGIFPYNKESVGLPFQFPIFLQPGIVVFVSSTFNTFADKNEIFACWLMGPGGVELPGTRHTVQATSKRDHSLLTVNCAGNIG